MTQKVSVPTPESRTMTFEPAGEGCVVVKDTIRTRYGHKAVLGGDTYDAKEAIKELDWDETHRGFDQDLKAWTIDDTDEALEALREVLEENGFTFGGVADEVARALRDNVDADESTFWAERGVEITVEYESKQSGNELRKQGVVHAVDFDDAFVAFQNDEGKYYRIQGDGVYSSSRYPFMGNATRVEVEVGAGAIDL